MPHDHWREYHTRWERLAPPLRPSAGVANAMRVALRECRGPALLLGVTPELASVASDVTAVDRSEGMIAAIWPGDTRVRRAVLGDWRALPFSDAHFAAAVGDGSLNAVTFPENSGALLAELRRVVRPGGRVVLRVFEQPEHVESPDTVIEEARAGRIESFHAFKWKLAMARVAELDTPNIAVQGILDAFEQRVTNRAAFALEAGWPLADVDTIDVYRGSAEVYGFPSRAELRAVFAPHFSELAFVEVTGYPLAERCPLVVAERPAD